MSTIEEIESAVAKLPAQDYAHFRKWLQNFDNKLWDKQLGEDVSSGKLDSLAAEALEDLENGRCSDL